VPPADGDGTRDFFEQLDSISFFRFLQWVRSPMLIRHLATSWSGSVIAAAEFERTVYVWDVAGGRHLATFPTIMDYGGTRLALTPDGQHCIAAAYHVEGIAAYDASDGTEVWRRKDLKKTQTLRVSLDGRRVYACFDNRSCQILNRETGKTIKTWAGVRDVWESPYQPVMLFEKRTLLLQSSEERKIARIPAETFAVLCVSFGPGLACVSESGGPLRCLETQTGEERWRFQEKGQHFLKFAFAEQAQSLVGVCWPYERGGSFRLLRFEPKSGEATVVADLGKAGEFEYCLRGTRLLSSDGSVIESATGQRVGMLAFPVPATGS
jgi:outer membrane protein assembly factor BamB